MLRKHSTSTDHVHGGKLGSRVSVHTVRSWAAETPQVTPNFQHPPRTSIRTVLTELYENAMTSCCCITQCTWWREGVTCVRAHGGHMCGQTTHLAAPTTHLHKNCPHLAVRECDGDVLLHLYICMVARWNDEYPHTRCARNAAETPQVTPISQHPPRTSMEAVLTVLCGNTMASYCYIAPYAWQ